MMTGQPVVPMGGGQLVMMGRPAALMGAGASALLLLPAGGVLLVMLLELV
jgi:hypothetical protein